MAQLAPKPQLVPNEERQFERRQLRERAWIVDPGQGRPYQCVVLDLSITGACIEVVEGMEIPDSLFLILNGEDQTMECRVTWRKREEFGVEFL